MNLLLLVEGHQTEPRVYSAWLKQLMPGIRPVNNVAGLTTDGYVLIRGNGYPSYLRRIKGLLQDLENSPRRVDSFWICVDSEELTYEERYAEIKLAVTEAAAQTEVWKHNPDLELSIIVQHCCLETWFLGHDGFMKVNPQDKELADFKRFYDVRTEDPEQMGYPPGYITKASFHLQYLRKMLKERGHHYGKDSPGIVLVPSYFQALRRRCHRTGHIRSFQQLLKAMDSTGLLDKT